MKTLRETIRKLDPEQVITLKNEHGVVWVGKSKFVFGAVDREAWTDNTLCVFADGSKVGD